MENDIAQQQNAQRTENENENENWNGKMILLNILTWHYEKESFLLLHGSVHSIAVAMTMNLFTHSSQLYHAFFN